MKSNLSQSGPKGMLKRWEIKDFESATGREMINCVQCCGSAKSEPDLWTSNAEAIGVLHPRRFRGMGPKKDESLSAEESSVAHYPQDSVYWAVVAVSK